MASFHLARSGFSLALRLRLSGPPPRRPSALSLRCRLREDGGESNGTWSTFGDERPESLFMKELKRRGINPTSLLEEGDGGGSIGSMESEEESRGGRDERIGRTKRNGVASAELDTAVSNQRERSMLLNSEGLEGLIPRAKLLLTIGGTFFLGFWPLILITLGLFLALYIYLGPSFVHDASKVPVLPPPYIDPYTLLEDERLSQVTPHVN
ncbi:unnamed protein product [Musa acuminata subsp. malaccensis]|uniref:(wild Malaysian banana) hypothetical protein n=1 Tax=Musa acuminata subsp. malaccensis TaxID=214687 RepID=A0A8D7AZK9_MUSAM|nr:unnamed protein product [Musa acuminata subsp. malaccensis]